jgi:hypothetical protein
MSLDKDTRYTGSTETDDIRDSDNPVITGGGDNADTAGEERTQSDLPSVSHAAPDAGREVF